MPTKTKVDEVLSVPKLNIRSLEVLIKSEEGIGMYYNRMSEKVKRELLNPPGTKTKAEKTMTLKHNPIEEFRSSAYRNDEFHPDTCLYLPAVTIKNAMVTAAMVTPGVTGADIRRLVSVIGDKIPIYGLPKLRMDVTRQAGINGAPDIRTRAFLPEWEAEVTIEYISPNLSKQSIMALLHNAGKVSGLGDFRQEKGKGNFGKFGVVNELTLDCSKADQIKRFESPVFNDDETASLMAYWQEDAKEKLDNLRRVA